MDDSLPPTTTTTQNNDNDKTTTTTLNNGFDFRDIHQHPPPTSERFTPLPPDPSWDAHRVYFNERHVAPKVRGDALDDVFGNGTDNAPVLYYEQLLPQEAKANDDDNNNENV